MEGSHVITTVGEGWGTPPRAQGTTGGSHAVSVIGDLGDPQGPGRMGGSY